MLNILYQFNEKYAPYAGVSITSLLTNNKESDKITFWILGENLSDDSINRLIKTVKKYSSVDKKREINFIDSQILIDKMIKLNIPSYRGSYAANMRLFVSEYIPKEIDLLLYLDADTIVAGDIEELFHNANSFILFNKTIAMAYDSLGENHKKELGLSPDEGYFNSGVVLFDMKKWRANDYTEQIINHVKNVRSNYPSPDQDLINILLKGDISTLPMKYNFQPFNYVYDNKAYFSCYGKTKYYSPEEIDYSKNNIIIYHFFRFVGEFPWHRGNVHPYNNLFDKYLKISLWSDYKKEYSRQGIIIKIEKYMYVLFPKNIFLKIFKIAHGRFYYNANKMSQKGKISKSM